MAIGPNWRLDEDLKTVTVSFPSVPPVALKLDAREVDEMLRNLGEFRAAMQPEAPRTFDRGQLVPTAADPLWQSEPDGISGGSLLHLRDPRFGWLHYLLPRDEARKLADLLQGQARRPKATEQGSGTAN